MASIGIGFISLRRGLGSWAGLLRRDAEPAGLFLMGSLFASAVVVGWFFFSDEGMRVSHECWPTLGAYVEGGLVSGCTLIDSEVLVAIPDSRWLLASAGQKRGLAASVDSFMKGRRGTLAVLKGDPSGTIYWMKSYGGEREGRVGYAGWESPFDRMVDRMVVKMLVLSFLMVACGVSVLVWVGCDVVRRGAANPVGWMFFVATVPVVGLLAYLVRRRRLAS